MPAAGRFDDRNLSLVAVNRPGLIELFGAVSDCRSVLAHPTTCSDAIDCSHRRAHVFETGAI